MKDYLTTKHIALFLQDILLVCVPGPEVFYLIGDSLNNPFNTLMSEDSYTCKTYTVCHFTMEYYLPIIFHQTIYKNKVSDVFEKSSL